MSWEDVNAAFNAVEQQQAKAREPAKELDFLEGAVKSFAYTFPEIIGVEPPEEVKKFREENVVTGLLTEAAGWLVPIGGYAKVSGAVTKGITKAVTTKAPEVARTIEGLAKGEQIVEKPFKAGLAREMVRFAPFEAGRVAAGAVLGEQVAEATDGRYIGTGNLAGEAITELALFGVTAGAFETFSSAGRALKQRIFPGADLSKPVQVQLRQMQEQLASGGVVDVEAASAAMRELAREVRRATPGKGKQYVNDLELGNAHDINRFMKPRQSETVNKLKFTQSVREPTFRTADERKAVEDLVGFEPGYEAYVQYPRFVEAKTRNFVRHVDRAFQKNMYPLDSSGGWFFNVDKADGLYLMGKKLDKGKWVVFKTDQPGRFVPSHAKYAETMQKRAAVFGADAETHAALGEGAEIFDSVLRKRADIPAVELRGTDLRRGNIAQVTKQVIEKSGLGALADKGSATFQGLEAFMKKYLAPTMFQNQHPLFVKSFAIAKSASDDASAIAEKIFLGKRSITKEGSLYRDIWKGATAKGGDTGVKGLISELYKSPSQVEAVWRTVNQQASIETGIAEHGLNEVGVAFLKKLQEIDRWVIAGLNKVQEAAGEKILQALENHFMISRTWKGDWRVPVMRGKKVIGYASGYRRAEALAEADSIAAEALKEGVKLRIGAPSRVGELRQDLVNLRRIDLGEASQFGKYKDAVWLSKNAPKRAYEARKGLGGYIGETKPWKKDELEQLVLKQLNDYQRYQAKLSVQTLLKDEMEHLRLYEPDTYEQLVGRINQIWGIQGPVSEAVNKAVDVVFAPYLGKNSASKITGAANRWMFRWTLGFANVGYNMANMLTFIQTSFPQVAFLTSASPEAISKYYSYWPVMGKQHVDGIGILDIMKLTRESFRKMGKPDPQLKKMFERAAQEGVWDPRFVEEFVGQKASQIKFGSVLKGEEPFSEWFGAVADAMPSFTEKFARGQSFAMGYTLFKDIFRVQDEELLYQMAKQFTEKTQFMYSTADRANIITGPVGGAFGLFKNWVMHYIGWMMEYTGEGVMRGNWKPLAYMMGGTTAVGGVGALPLYGAADALSQWLSDDSLMVNAYNAFGGKDGELGAVADTAFYWLPAMLGFSVQNQVSAPGVDIAQDASRLFSLAYVDRMKYAGQAFGQAIDSWGATGRHPAQDARTRDLMMRAFAPKMLYRTTQAVQDQTLRSLSTGYPVQDLDLMGRVMYAAGVNPVTLEKTYAASGELWADADKMKAAVTKYGKAWAEAVAAADNEAVRRVMNRAILEGVDLGTVIKSGKARLAKGKEDMIERQFSPEAIFPYRQAGIIR